MISALGMIIRISRLHLLLVCFTILDSVGTVKICRGGMGTIFPQTSNCYYVIPNSKTYLTAKSQCIAMSGYLVSITTAEEDDFIRSNLTLPFWIGLSDSSAEGEFRWEEANTLYQTSDYGNWMPNWQQNNDEVMDCVHYNMGMQWEVQRCEFNYKPLCEFSSCESNDGVYCEGEAPTSPPAPFNIVPIIAVVIVLIIVIVVIVVVIVLLFYLYKKHNDLWKRFCSCLTFSKTKQKVHGLEHENFRLRKELNNLKHQSINLSGSQSINKPPTVTSIPDGQGGMLPSIRPKQSLTLSSSFVPPQILPVPPPSDPTKPGPPPLTQNTSLLQSSLNYPVRTPSLVPTPLPQPNMNTSITSEQIAGILWSEKSDFQVPKKPSLNFPQAQIPSRSIFQSPYPTASTPFSFPAGGNPITPTPTALQPAKNSGKEMTTQHKNSQEEDEQLKSEHPDHIPAAENQTDSPEVKP